MESQQKYASYTTPSLAVDNDTILLLQFQLQICLKSHINPRLTLAGNHKHDVLLVNMILCKSPFISQQYSKGQRMNGERQTQQVQDQVHRRPAATTHPSTHPPVHAAIQTIFAFSLQSPSLSNFSLNS